MNATTRSPQRISLILQALKEEWERNPEMRLTQLIVNLVKPNEPCPQVFYFEDAMLLEVLLLQEKK
jgi:uncharacterized protein YihD (DUF1040 family)